MLLFSILLVLTLGPFYLFFFIAMIAEILEMMDNPSFWFRTSGLLYLLGNWLIVAWGGYGWYCLFT